MLLSNLAPATSTVRYGLALNGLMAPLRYGSVFANRLLQMLLRPLKVSSMSNKSTSRILIPRYQIRFQTFQAFLTRLAIFCRRCRRSFLQAKLEWLWARLLKALWDQQTSVFPLPMAPPQLSSLVISKISLMNLKFLSKKCFSSSLCASAHIIVSSPVSPGLLVTLRAQSSDTRSILRSIARPSPRPRLVLTQRTLSSMKIR